MCTGLYMTLAMDFDVVHNPTPKGEDIGYKASPWWTSSSDPEVVGSNSGCICLINAIPCNDTQVAIA